MVQLVSLYFFVFIFSSFLVSPFDSNSSVLGVSKRNKVISPIASGFNEVVKSTPTPVLLRMTPTVISSVSATPSKKNVASVKIRKVEVDKNPIDVVITPSISVSKQDYLIQKINEYRRSQGLADVQPNDQTCSFAKVRAAEISSDFSHAGFRQRIDNKSLPYPDYKNVTENIAMNSDHTKVVEMWISSSGHAENMRKDTPFVCVAEYQNYYAYEGFRP